MKKQGVRTVVTTVRLPSFFAYVATTLATLLLTWPAATCRGDTQQPNILFIVADDLGWGHVGWQNAKVKTPHLDRLVADGVQLDQHYVAHVCSPTRVSLLTGRYWSRFRCNGPLASDPTSHARAMPPDTVTVAAALQSTGYRTALVGKWHLGAQLDSGPERFGFEYFYGIRVGGCTPLTHKWLGIGPTVLWEGEEIVEQQGHVTDLFGEAAVNWMGKEADRPFFLFLSFTAPHVPLQESDRWMDMYEASAPDVSHQLYRAAISHLDNAVGQVLAELDRTGRRENTLVVFFGDNGAPGQRNLMQVRADHDAYLDVVLPGRNLPLRGKKGDVYEGGIRTPALVSWPATLQPGTCNTPLHVTDWMPTISALVGFQAPHDLKWDGLDMMPFVKDPDLRALDRPLYNSKGGTNGFALRQGAWKLVLPRKKGQTELYNIADDIGETSNLAAKHPEIVQRLQDLQNDAAVRDNDAVPEQ